MILDRLGRNSQFMSAALPLKIVPPLFNRYRDGQAYGNHVDGGVRPVAGSAQRVRTDLSATIFLTDPADYDGGELVVEDNFGSRSIKLASGDMVMYPGTSVHQVTPVTRGAPGSPAKRMRATAASSVSATGVSGNTKIVAVCSELGPGPTRRSLAASPTDPDVAHGTR